MGVRIVTGGCWGFFLYTGGQRDIFCPILKKKKKGKIFKTETFGYQGEKNPTYQEQKNKIPWMTGQTENKARHTGREKGKE